MREILFRAKRATTGDWIYGDLVENQGDLYIYCSSVLTTFPLDGTEIAVRVYKVDSKTVGQYTGMKDGNGKKIFEGDIVDCWSEGVNAKGTVQQRNDGLWIIYPAWQKRIMWGLCPDDNGNTTVVVIGNIHD